MVDPEMIVKLHTRCSKCRVSHVYQVELGPTKFGFCSCKNLVFSWDGAHLDPKCLDSVVATDPRSYMPRKT